MKYLGVVPILNRVRDCKRTGYSVKYHNKKSSFDCLPIHKNYVHLTIRLFAYVA